MKLCKKNILLLIIISAINSYAQITIDSTLSAIYDIRYSNPDSALDMLEEVEQKEISQQHQGRINDYRGDVFWYKGEFQNSIAHYSKNIELYNQLNDSLNIGMTLADIGYIYMDMKEYQKALELYQQAFDIAIKYKSDDLIYLTSTYKGQLNQMLGNYHKALESYQDAIDSDLKKNNEKNIAILHNNMASVYVSMEKFDEAIKSAEIAYPTWIKLKDKNGLANYNTTMGTAYSLKKEFRKAEEYLLVSEKLNFELGKKIYLSEVYFCLIDVYIFKKDISKVEEYINKLLIIVQQNPNPNLLESYYQMLSEYYFLVNKYDSAYHYLNRYVVIKDSTLNQSKQEQITLLSAQFDSEKKEYDIRLLKAEHEKDTLIIEQRNTQLYFTLIAVFIFLILLVIIFRNYKQKNKAYQLVSAQKNEIEIKNKEIKDSITYAKRIQNAILPANKLVKEYLPDSFIYYKPKDVVAGDFYWIEHKYDKVYFAAADCTGHGVPGAMVSVVCNNALNRTVREFNLNTPADILNKTKELVVEEFSKSDNDVNDGMDIALCSLDTEKLILEYAGAHNPLWLFRRNELIEYKADRFPIGKTDSKDSFVNHTIKLEKGDTIYIFSDGYADQFGGKDNIKYSTKSFKKLLLSLQSKPMYEQHQMLNHDFEKWRGEEEQLDDVCIIGLRI